MAEPAAAGVPAPAENHFLHSQQPLRPMDAVAALLVLPDGRYVMQLRDNLPQIFYPDHWGCFGGAVSDGEMPMAALQRELYEELEYSPTDAVEFTRFDFDFSQLGQSKVYRIFYEVAVPHAAFETFVLHEGAAYRAITGEDLLMRHRVTPYDAFAIWMHMSKRRLQSGAGSYGE